MYYMKAGFGLFDIKKSEAGNSEASLLDQENFINFAFCCEGCHDNSRTPN